MKNYTITTSETLKDWTSANNVNANGISIWVENRQSLYIWFENLCKACTKKFAKYGGLDLDYLSNCSTLKAITRQARKELSKIGESYTMQEDASARKYLAVAVFEYCSAVLSI